MHVHHDCTFLSFFSTCFFSQFSPPILCSSLTQYNRTRQDPSRWGYLWERMNPLDRTTLGPEERRERHSHVKVCDVLECVVNGAYGLLIIIIFFFQHVELQRISDIFEQIDSVYVYPLFFFCLFFRSPFSLLSLLPLILISLIRLEILQRFMQYLSGDQWQLACPQVIQLSGI